MAIPYVEFSMKGYKIRKAFAWKLTVVQLNYLILRFGVVAKCVKIGHHFRKKSDLKIDVTKKCQ